MHSGSIDANAVAPAETNGQASSAPAAPPPPAAAVAPAAARAPFWNRVDVWTVWGSEFLNPILVKESRQALKSKQFAITFMLVLICGWVWSMFGVAWIGPSIYYGEHGATMFSGYYIIMALPMLIIVPFSAFRSLASEREDGTF